MERRIRVLIADDRPSNRDGLRALLAACPETEVIGEAVDGLEALRLVEACRPDVVVMDVRMRGMDGVEATRRIKAQWPGTRVITLTIYGERRSEALAAGSDVFLLKGCASEDLLAAILEPASTPSVSPR